MDTKTHLIKAHMRGTIYALTTTLVFVLVLALVIRLSGIAGTTVAVLTQIIKVISIFYGTAIVLKTVEKMGWLHGIVLGLIYTILAFFAFSIIGSNFDITTGIFAEMLFAGAVGSVSALVLRMGTPRNA